jgi:hypothetical protein
MANVNVFIQCPSYEDAGSCVQALQARNLKPVLIRGEQGGQHYICSIQGPERLLQIRIGWQPRDCTNEVVTYTLSVIERFQPSYVFLVGSMVGFEGVCNLGDVIVASSCFYPEQQRMDKTYSLLPEQKQMAEKVGESWRDYRTWDAPISLGWVMQDFLPFRKGTTHSTFPQALSAYQEANTERKINPQAVKDACGLAFKLHLIKSDAHLTEEGSNFFEKRVHREPSRVPVAHIGTVIGGEFQREDFTDQLVDDMKKRTKGIGYDCSSIYNFYSLIKPSSKTQLMSVKGVNHFGTVWRETTFDVIAVMNAFAWVCAFIELHFGNQPGAKPKQGSQPLRDRQKENICLGAVEETQD